MKIIGGIRSVLRAWVFYVDPLHWHYLDQARRQAREREHRSEAVEAGEEHAAGLGIARTLTTYELTQPIPGGAADNSFLQPPKPPWRAPLTHTTHDLVPTLSLLGVWTACKDLPLPDGNEDAWVWVDDVQRAAVFDGATESFAARRWVSILTEAWKQDSAIDLEALQLQYADAGAAMTLSWAQEEAAGRGSFTTVASVQAAPGGLAATCVGDSAILLVKDARIVEAYPSLDPADYSSVPDALGSSSEHLNQGHGLLEACSWTIPVSPGHIDMVVLATDAVAVWLLQGNRNHTNELLAATLQIDDQAHWEHIVAGEREAGRMKADDSTVMILKVAVAA